MKFSTYSMTCLLSASLIGLSACGSTATAPAMSNQDVINNALVRAADQASVGGITPEGLKLIETAYKRSPQNPSVALRYARALREAGQSARALVVLEPFVKEENTEGSIELEYIAIQLEDGRYRNAEKSAQKLITKNPKSGFGYHLLGTALDAQGRHSEAETAFRQALDNWTGDPVPLMNNLALSLAAQEKLEEALKILDEAKRIDPSRMEVERNRRIISALKETIDYVPKPGRSS